MGFGQRYTVTYRKVVKRKLENFVKNGESHSHTGYFWNNSNELQMTQKATSLFPKKRIFFGPQRYVTNKVTPGTYQASGGWILLV